MKAGQNVGLSCVQGEILSCRSFFIEHIATLDEFEQQLILSELHYLSERKSAYPFEMPVLAQPCVLKDEHSALLHDSDSIIWPDKGWFLNGCIAKNKNAFLTKEAVCRELLGYLLHRKFGWALSRFPVAVLRYGNRNEFALFMTLAPGFHSLKHLFVDEIILPFKRTMNLLPRRLHSGAAKYQQSKAEQLAQMHACGIFRTHEQTCYLREYYCRTRYVVSFVGFSQMIAIDWNALTRPQILKWLEYAIIEAILSMAPNCKIVERDCFATLESEALKSGFLATYLRELGCRLELSENAEHLVADAWCEVKRTPLYRQVIARIFDI